MYITINNIKGEKRIDLSYSIQNSDSTTGRGEASMECLGLGACTTQIVVIRMFSNNVKYRILKLRAVMDPISGTKKMTASGIYGGRKLLSI